MAEEEERFSKVFDLLQANSDKDFVKRILDAKNSPFIDNGPGNDPSTHKMAVEVGEALGEEAADKRYVFPTIQREQDGNLVDYKDWKAAWGPAKAKDDFMEFDTAEEADWFERNWKVVWGHPPRTD